MTKTFAHTLLALLAIGLSTMATSCASKTPVSAGDSGVADQGRRPDPADTGANVDTGSDAPGPVADAQLPLDGPKVPAHWTTVQGQGPKVEDHTATLLADGRVLIVGGTANVGGTDFVTYAESWLYDPATDSIAPAGKMKTPRVEHTASLLPDGRVLVIGGKNDESKRQDSSEIFDPTKPAAQAWSDGPTMPQIRAGHTAVTLASGRVMVAGGLGSWDSLRSVLLYDPSVDPNDFLIPAKTMAEQRRFHTATLLANDKVLIAGGLHGTSFSDRTWPTTLEIYDPQSGGFTTLSAKMSDGRSGHQATLLPSGEVLIVGGYCGSSACAGISGDDIYNPLKDTVTLIAHPGSDPIAHANALLHDGRVMVLGDDNHRDLVYLFSLGGGGLWQKGPSPSVPRSRTTATTLDDGSVLIVGGLTTTDPEFTYTDVVERFIP